MRIICYGARANTPEQSDVYQNRTLIVIQSKQTTIWVDCAETWRGKLGTIDEQPDAIFITHTHKDHAGGLKDSAPSPVYASNASWDEMDKYGINKEHRHTIASGETVNIGDLKVTAHNVHHSVHAPAQAYRIHDGNYIILYSSDIADLDNAKATLNDVDIYIGDGSIVTRTMLLRETEEKQVGHAPIQKQMTWCAEHNISHALFVHCGAAIISKPYEDAQAWIRKLGHEQGVYADIAHDGYTTTCESFLHKTFEAE